MQAKVSAEDPERPGPLQLLGPPGHHLEAAGAGAAQGFGATGRLLSPTPRSPTPPALALASAFQMCYT